MIDNIDRPVDNLHHLPLRTNLSFHFSLCELVNNGTLNMNGRLAGTGTISVCRMRAFQQQQ